MWDSCHLSQLLIFINLFPLQPHTSSCVDCIGRDGNELSFLVDLSFDVVQLLELNIKTMLMMLKMSYLYISHETRTNLEAEIYQYEIYEIYQYEIYHIDVYDIENGDAFDPTTIPSNLGNEQFIELSDFLYVRGAHNL